MQLNPLSCMSTEPLRTFKHIMLSSSLEGLFTMKCGCLAVSIHFGSITPSLIICWGLMSQTLFTIVFWPILLADNLLRSLICQLPGGFPSGPLAILWLLGKWLVGWVWRLVLFFVLITCVCMCLTGACIRYPYLIWLKVSQVGYPNSLIGESSAVNHLPFLLASCDK